MPTWRPRASAIPGSLFPWQRLAEAGFGRWPQGELVEPPAGFDPWLAMAAIGYPLNDRAAAVRAFHRHYRGRDDGEDPQPAFDAEDLRILHALATQRCSAAGAMTFLSCRSVRARVRCRKPSVRFMIACAARTGSTMLVRTLRSHPA